MKALVLMAGPDSLFHEAGHPFPKNLVEIDGVPLVERVVESLQPIRALDADMIFAIRRDEHQTSHTGAVINLLAAQATVILTPTLTAGAACTALLAIDHINSDDPLLVVNGDQIVDVDLPSVIRGFQDKKLDGGLVVFNATHPRWSYVRTNEQGLVVEAAEKHPISRLATAGIYYFARGRDFVVAVFEMIKKEATVGGRFYVCPCYNELILRQARIGVHEIARTSYHSLATPQGVDEYVEYLRSHRERV